MKLGKLNSSLFSNIALGILVVIVLSLWAIRPLLMPGFFGMHDDTQVVRIFDMALSLKDGMFPVRWVSNLGYGYGYPIFNFYAPFAYYIGGLITLIGFDVLTATKITFAIGILAAGVSMYLFLRNVVGQFPAIAAGVLYVYLPYHAVNIYVRGALAELYAYIFLPLVFWGLYKLVINSQKKEKLSKSFKWIALTAVSFACVAISHNLSALMTLLVVISFFIGAFLFVKKKMQFTSWVIFSFVLLIMVASFYVLPAIFEMGYTNVSSQVGGGADYPDHFVCFGQLINSQWGFGGSVPGCTDGLSFKIGRTNILLIVVSLAVLSFALFKKKIDDKNIAFLSVISFALLLISVFLTLPYARFIWDSIPGMEYLQYPWRFLNYVSLFGCILVGLGIYAVQKMFGKFVMYGSVIFVLGITLVFNAKLFEPQTYLDKTARDYTYFPYMRYTVSKISDEYMPQNFEKPGTDQDFIVTTLEVSTGSAQISDFKRKTGDISAVVNASGPATLKYNIAYFPAWHFYVDSQEVNPQISNTGVLVPIKSGIYTVSANFRQTTIEKIGNILSVLGILAVITGIIKFDIIKKHGKKAS